MIDNILLKFGRSANKSPTSFEPTPVTVFVGPNNSGKSKILREIQYCCTSGAMDPQGVMVQGITFTKLNQSDARRLVDSITLPPDINEPVPLGHIRVGTRGLRRIVDRNYLLEALTKLDEVQFQSYVIENCIGFSTLMLDGINRINLVNEQEAGDLLATPQSSFRVLFHDNKRRKEVQRILHDAFNNYLTIDPTNLGKFRLRFATVPPSCDMQEQGIHPDALAYQQKAIPIYLMSDGVKAFTGLITEIIAGDPLILLIDEPEAFLHPTLSFVLGKEISKAMMDTTKRLFASTHSSKFVMGCVQSGMPVNIVRLTYQDSIATARVLNSQELLTLMKNPLLRSTKVLESLFYEFVVVAESDTDRAFYEEINERLLTYKKEAGISSCLFLNAQNKQTIRAILKPLREIGVPTAAIVDIDILKDGGKNWSELLEAIFIPDLEKESLAVLRRNVLKQLEQAASDEFKREGGLDLLGGNDKYAAENLLSKLASYGLFVVKRGELESWLPGLNVSGHGPSWLIEIFEKMGENPESSDYLRPTEGDVWHFISSIKDWFSKAERQGIPD